MPPLDVSKDLVALFAQQARATPEAIAAEDGITRWTYAALDEASDRLAAHLRQTHGVDRDVLVGVLMGHTVQYVLASLAAMKAGGAFLVLEVAYPPSLLAEVLDDARPAVVLASPDQKPKLPKDLANIVLADDLSLQQYRDQFPNLLDVPSSSSSPSSSSPPTDLDRLAFASYSSGTTGRPKGILNPHTAAVRSYNLRFQIHNNQPGDRVAVNVYFVWEMLRPLLRGATVVTVPDDVSFDPVGLVEFLEKHAITETLMTPTLLATVMARYPLEGPGRLSMRLPKLRALWLNGEVVPVDLARRALAALPEIRLLNCYSASETHEIACCDLTPQPWAADATVCPTGRPLDPEHMYVLDEDGQRLLPGQGSGELFVGGDLLARGYLNRPEMTVAAFLPDVFSKKENARMYRTGDRASLLPSGDLEITGRVGGMIKVRGYSVQPAAVESAITRHLVVRNCVVVGDKEGLEKQLVAYVVLDNAAAGRVPLVIDADGHSPQARRLLTQHLAHYMIPSVWVQLDALPTHAVSGKVDVKGLPRPSAATSTVVSAAASIVASTAVSTVASASAAASAVASTAASTAASLSSPSATIDDIRKHWALVLGVHIDSVQEPFDFFDLGGHSLALAHLANDLSKAYQVDVPLLALVRTPTLEGHLATVQAAQKVAPEDDNDDDDARTERDVDSDEAVQLLAMMQEDSVLPHEVLSGSASGSASDSTPASTSASTSASPKSLADASTILLTGATGFLGAFLLSSLLEKTNATIACLVRANSTDGTKPMARLRRHLLDLGLWQDSMVDRLQIVAGDLAHPRLGLHDDVYRKLTASVEAIVHAGAHVNLIYPYDALRDANVGGTLEILRLAADAKDCPATVHYISTNGVLPPDAKPYAEGVTIDAAAAVQLESGYDQTKWVAEALVRAAADRGLPARIYRPGTLSGHSRTGAANARDVVTALLVEALCMGCAPAIEGWRVEMTPVDFVSDAIVSLGSDSDDSDDSDDSEGKEGESKNQDIIFHVGDPDAVLAKDLFRSFADLGYPTVELSWHDWTARWKKERGTSLPLGAAAGVVDDSEDDSPTAILRAGMPSRAFLDTVTMLDDAVRTRPLLAEKHNLVRPVLDADLLRTYARHFYARGWLPSPPVAASSLPSSSPAPSASSSAVDNRPLAGRVAVVTGASSGIGAAIASHLAAEGVHVAMGARRLATLKQLQSRIEARHPAAKIISVATDVTRAADVKTLVSTAESEFGSPVDIYISCAGVMYFTMMTNVQTDDWDRTVDVNCKGLLHGLAAVVPSMVARGGTRSHIVAISSDAGRKVFPGLGVYSGSKFFVEAVLQSLRVETAGTGLRVTSIQPGNTETELLGMSSDPEALEKYGAPSGAKVLDPDDVAESVIYALRQPPHVAVNEILIEPRDEPC